MAPFYSSQVSLTRKLIQKGITPIGMVYVEGLFSWFAKISSPEQSYIWINMK